MNRITPFLWFDKNGLEAAQFYAETFPDSSVDAVHRAASDYPDGREGDVLVVEFTVLGLKCAALNGGPVFQHSEAFSLQVSTKDQAETDRYWNAIVANGGKESACGWCRDRFGIHWQITPEALTRMLNDRSDPDASRRAMQAMMGMGKIDIAALEAAYADADAD